jgi:excisionase family DNA binding protein
VDVVEQQLFSLRDAAVYLGIPLETVRYWTRPSVGRIPVVRVGQKSMIQRAVLEQIVSEGLQVPHATVDRG